MNGIREILGFKCECAANFKDDEVIEVCQNDLDEQDEEKPDVLYPGTTMSSNKKHRLEYHVIPVHKINQFSLSKPLVFTASRKCVEEKYLVVFGEKCVFRAESHKRSGWGFGEAKFTVSCVVANKLKGDENGRLIFTCMNRYAVLARRQERVRH